MFIRVHTPLTLASLVLLAGCVQDHTAAELNQQAAQNEWIVGSYHQEMVRAGVISQATLWEHHFVPGAAELNDLGARDVALFAEHLSRSTGSLNVRRGGADEALYTARLDVVRQALAGGGVPADRVVLADTQSGGPGLAADRAVLVLERDVQPLDSIVSTRSQQNVSPKTR